MLLSATLSPAGTNPPRSVFLKTRPRTACWSPGARLPDVAVEAEQQQLVKVYAEAAHKRGLAVLGLVYAAGDASKIAADAARAALDGLVLEGEFAPEFPAALRKAADSMLVVEIAKDAAPWRWKPAPIVAVAGVAPSARNLSEMGIRGAPSSEPWIKSNIWLVRSFGLASPSRPVWISDQIENASAVDYARTVADAAAAGGRWIVSLDDALRAKLRARDASALEAWRRISSYLKFAESHAAWRALAPYGNVGIVLDPASTKQDLADEYLNLAARRQVPYRLVARSGLNAASVAKFRALVTTDLDSPSAAERKLLQDFAENGGLVIAGPSWAALRRRSRSLRSRPAWAAWSFTKIQIPKRWCAISRNCSRTTTWAWSHSMCRR